MHDTRIKYFRGESFVPLGAARNLAMQKCDGSWIAFLDSDDLWDHDFLLDQMSALAGKEKTSFGFGFVTEFFQDSKTIPNFGKEKKQIQTEISIFEKLLKGNFIYFSSLIFSREALYFLKGFKEEFVQAEDYELLLRLAYKFDAIQTGHVYYRLHSNNLSKSQTKELYSETLSILQKYQNFFAAKIFSSITLANLALFSIRKRNCHIFNQIRSSVNLKLGYLFVGIVILLARRTKRIIKFLLNRILTKTCEKGS
jgi:glycosyltransferase involved in cell wall biosynthesis